MSSAEMENNTASTEELGNQVFIISSPTEQQRMMSPFPQQLIITSPDSGNYNNFSLEFTNFPYSSDGPGTVYHVPITEISNSTSSSNENITVTIQDNVELEGPIDLSASTAIQNWQDAKIIIENVHRNGHSNIYIPAQLTEYQPEESEIPIVKLPNLLALNPVQNPVQRRTQKKRKFTSYNDDKQWIPARTQKDPGTKPVDVLSAAQALFSKRTRTLYRWIYPHLTKNEVKIAINKAWDELENHEREFYFIQVLGRYSTQPRPLMVNPLINRLLNKHDQDETSSAVYNLLRAEDRMVYPMCPVAPIELPAKRARGRRRTNYTACATYVPTTEEEEAVQALSLMRDETVTQETSGGFQFNTVYQESIELNGAEISSQSDDDSQKLIIG